MKVLVALDHSPSSETILQAVTGRPWPANTTFCVLSVTNLQRFERLPALIEDATHEGERLTECGARRIRAAGYDAFPKTTPGHPRSDISCFAKEWGADLILVGSHGHSAVGRFLLGSVAQGVLRTAPCSVEVVRPAPHGSPFKILLATDGSEFSRAAVRAIAGQPWPQGSLLKILSVEELMPIGAGNAMDASSLSAVYPASLLEELVTEARGRARSAVDEAKEVLAKAGLALADGSGLPVGEPRSVILDTAKAWDADLIVVGSHGRRGFDRFLMGSVSEAVAIHATCSVRVIRTSSEKKG